MPRAPAVCDSCQFVFPSIVPLGTNTTFQNVTASPCPKCGGKGSIPDGTYSAIDGVITAVATSKISRDQLARLLVIVRSQSSGSTIAQQIESEVPEGSVLARYIPENASQLAAYLAILVALLTTVIQSCDRGETQTINIDQVIQHLYNGN